MSNVSLSWCKAQQITILICAYGLLPLVELQKIDETAIDCDKTAMSRDALLTSVVESRPLNIMTRD